MKLYEGAFADATAYDVRMTGWELQAVYARANLTQAWQSVGNTLRAYCEGAFTSEQAMTALVGYYALGVQTVEREYFEREIQRMERQTELQATEEVAA